MRLKVLSEYFDFKWVTKNICRKNCKSVIDNINEIDELLSQI